MEIKKYLLDIHDHLDTNTRLKPTIMSSKSVTGVKTSVLNCLSRVYNLDLNIINDNHSHMFILNDDNFGVVAIIIRKYTSSPRDSIPRDVADHIDLCNYTIFNIEYTKKTWSNEILDLLYDLDPIDLIIDQLVDVGVLENIDGVLYSFI